jgi:hypothetical protein
VIAIQGRSGVGQEFELEFHGYMVGVDVFVAIPESKTFHTPRLVPGAAAGATSLRWALHDGEQRLVIEIGARRFPFDEAPEDLRKALNRWVERLANVLRKGRYT